MSRNKNKNKINNSFLPAVIYGEKKELNKESKKLIKGYSLDDDIYEYINFNEFIAPLLNNKEIEIGDKYYVGVFELENASKYCPKIDNRELIQVLCDIEEEGFDSDDDSLIPALSKDNQKKFDKELKSLIDKYFVTNMNSFISKQRMVLTKEDTEGIKLKT